MTQLTQPGLAAIHRLTVKQYHRMIEAAVLTEDDPVEFLEGWIVKKMPHNPAHDGTISRIQKRLERELSDEWLIRIQSSVTTRDSEPEPDLAIVAGPMETYLERHPTPFDVAMIVEVSDSSLDSDRTVKGRLYARARIPMYWIANLVDGVIEVYSEPVRGRNPRYRSVVEFTTGDRVPFVIDEKRIAEIDADDLLPVTGRAG